MGDQELLGRALPKWPQHLVTGVPVTVEQAKEIIRRTDTFLVEGHGGNDHAWDEKAMKLLKMPNWRDKDHTWEKSREWREKWRAIETEYVHNSWLSCSFIGGPHGWCHPDGKIGFTDNVGKWPKVESVYGDWKLIAEAFPFLEVEATLMSGEGSEEGTKPIVSFEIHGGKVYLVDPEEKDVHFGRRMPAEMDVEVAAMRLVTMHHSKREHGVPWEWIEEWAKLVEG